MDEATYLPPGRTTLENNLFQFRCHSGVSCYLTCCRDVNMLLFPYDIVLLKNHLKISSTDFIERFAELCEGSHPFFPGLKLKLTPGNHSACPFLGQGGCTVYSSRPSACRTYPLERAVEYPGAGTTLKVHYFLTRHPYCKGHFEAHFYSVKEWERDQDLYDCNLYNDLWAELDAFFSTNPWAGEGKAGPYQKLAFMVCYDIDRFRNYVNEHALLDGFRLRKDERQRLKRNDGALLTFGFRWLEYILGGEKKLIKK